MEQGRLESHPFSLMIFPANHNSNMGFSQILQLKPLFTDDVFKISPIFSNIFPYFPYIFPIFSHQTLGPFGDAELHRSAAPRGRSRACCMHRDAIQLASLP